jgi:hypothetical protein
LAEEFRKITKKEMQNIIESYKNSFGRWGGSFASQADTASSPDSFFKKERR